MLHFLVLVLLAASLSMFCMVIKIVCVKTVELSRFRPVVSVVRACSGALTRTNHGSGRTYGGVGVGGNVIIGQPGGWSKKRRHDGTDDGTAVGRYTTGHCAVVVYVRRTHDGHTTGHWPVALFKRRDRR